MECRATNELRVFYSCCECVEIVESPTTTFSHVPTSISACVLNMLNNHPPTKRPIRSSLSRSRTILVFGLACSRLQIVVSVYTFDACIYRIASASKPSFNVTVSYRSHVPWPLCSAFSSLSDTDTDIAFVFHSSSSSSRVDHQRTQHTTKRRDICAWISP